MCPPTVLSPPDAHRLASPLRLWLPWVIGSILILVFVARDWVLTRNGIIDHSVVWGRDFINVWTGGHLVRDGQFATLYDPTGYAAYQRGLFGAIDPHNYSYPPTSYPLAAGLSLLPYSVALAVWLTATAALFAVSARSWWPRSAGPYWLAVATPAALVNIWAGHYGFVLGALFLLGWQNLDRRPTLAGMFFGLMLIKPHMAVLVPLALLIRGDWRAMGSAAATVVGSVLATAVAYGVTPWTDYLFRTLSVQATMINAHGKFFGNLSTSMTTGLLEAGAPWSVAVAFQVASTALGILLVTLAARRRPATRDLALLVATCTFLVLPYAFSYDLTVVAIGALWVCTRAHLPGVDERLAILGFVAPQLGIAAALVSLPLMPFMLVGLAIAQFRELDFPQISGRAAPASADATHSA